MSSVGKKQGHDKDGPWPTPPPAPTSIAGLAQEMLGCMSSCPGLYQGQLRFWLMWRLPQLLSLIRGAPGLKFHYCSARPQDLFRDYLRLFLLPDLLVIGQSGPLLQHEFLSFEHGFDKTWPNVDGTHDALSVFAGKMDRPLPDEIASFVQFFFAPLSATGRLLHAPYSTMFAGVSPVDSSFERVIDILESAMKQSAPDGLPMGFSMKGRMKQAKQEFARADAPASLPLAPEPAPDDPMKDWPKGWECRQGRWAKPDALIPLIDPYWQPNDILALEFCVSRYFDTMLLVGGDWTRLVPDPSYHFDLRIPYVEGIPPEALARSIADDPEAFGNFRKTISKALSEAVECTGSEALSKELKRIQSDIIDDGIAELERRWRDLMKMRFARFGAYTSAAIALEIGLYFGSSLAEVAMKLATSAAVGFFAEASMRRAEQNKLRASPMYFIWRLRA